MVQEHELLKDVQASAPEYRCIKSYNRGDAIFEEGSRGKEM